MKKLTQQIALLLLLPLVFVGSAFATSISWDVSAAGAPAFDIGDTNSFTGAFNQINFFAQTSTFQFDTDGSGGLLPTVGDEFTDSGEMKVQSLLAGTTPDMEGLNLTYEVTARWVDVKGVVTKLTDTGGGSFRVDVRFTEGMVFMFLDSSIDASFANPYDTIPPVGSGGSGFNDGTLIATLKVKDGFGHTFVVPGGSDIENQGSIDLALEFTEALDGFWYDETGTEELDLEGHSLTVLLDMNYDRTLQVTGSGEILYSLHSNEDGSIYIETGCINLEKEVSVDGGQTWFDADFSAEAPTTGMAALYRLIVTNCGDMTLTGVTLKDILPSSTTNPETILFNVPIGDLQPGESQTFNADQPGFSGLDAPNRCLDDWGPAFEGAPDGIYLNTAYVTSNENYNDQDPAWVNCRREEDACRMTGGSVTVNDFFAPDGEPFVFYSYVDGTYGEATDAISTKGNSKKQSVSEYQTWVTTGGQIGAPSTDPATGHWEHTQHAGKEGNFTFLAGTASAPPGTEIAKIDCADPGWCVQARCAPFKQIFWDGVGYFANKHGGTVFNANFPDPTCTVNPGGPSRDGTLHYFRAMVGDFGENDSPNRKPDNPDCNWFDYGGPSGFDVSEVVPLDAVSDDQFGDKGGQVCDKCADYYQIEIYCGADENDPGEVIYTFADYIDGGNFQIHPETSEHCTADLFNTTTQTNGNGNGNGKKK